MIYKMQIPPFPVKSFDLLTTRQAKEIFKWYTDDIPARLDQLQKCIDADVNGTVQLTRGKDSLRPLWSWLVANIQLQELTESDLKESLDAVPKWLHEYIVAGKYKLTTESLSIGMDVAISSIIAAEKQNIQAQAECSANEDSVVSAAPAEDEMVAEVLANASFARMYNKENAWKYAYTYD